MSDKVVPRCSAREAPISAARAPAYLDVGLGETGDVEQEGVLAGSLHDVHRRAAGAGAKAVDARVPAVVVRAVVAAGAAVAVRCGEAVENLRQVEEAGHGRVEQLRHGFLSYSLLAGRCCSSLQLDGGLWVARALLVLPMLLCVLRCGGAEGGRGWGIK